MYSELSTKHQSKGIKDS